MESTLTIAAFVLGMTQVIKDGGFITGQWLKLVAVALGAFATFLSLYYPELWQQLSAILVSVGVTGSVSFVNEQTKKFSPAV